MGIPDIYALACCNSQHAFLWSVCSQNNLLFSGSLCYNGTKYTLTIQEENFLMGLFTKIFGTRSDRELKKIQPVLDKILALEEEYKNLSEDELKGKTARFKERLQ